MKGAGCWRKIPPNISINLRNLCLGLSSHYVSFVKWPHTWYATFDKPQTGALARICLLFMTCVSPLLITKAEGMPKEESETIRPQMNFIVSSRLALFCYCLIILLDNKKISFTCDFWFFILSKMKLKNGADLALLTWPRNYWRTWKPLILLTHLCCRVFRSLKPCPPAVTPWHMPGSCLSYLLGVTRSCPIGSQWCHPDCLFSLLPSVFPIE